MKQGIATMLAALLLAVTLPAQGAEGARRKVTGRVLDREGKPWAGATVTFLARPIPEYAHVDDADEVQAVTGADGVCSADLLTFRRYSAWAHARVAAGGHRLTGIDNEVCCNASFELRERDAPQPPSRIKVAGADKVTQWGAMSHRLVDEGPRNVVVRKLVLDERGEAEVPPLPSAHVLYEVLTPTEVRLFTAGLPLTSAVREQHLERAKAGHGRNVGVSVERPELITVHLPEPTEITVRVVSSDGKTGVAAATIGLGAQSSAGSILDVYEARPVATTDADGVARVPMLVTWGEDDKAGWPRPSLLIHSDTHGERFVRSFQMTSPETEPLRSKPVLEVRLKPGAHAVKGRLLARAGEPCRGVPVLVYQKANWISNRPSVHRTDGEGRFRIPGRPNGSAWRITALVPAPGDTHLEEVWLHALTASDDVDLGDLRVDELVTVHCHVTHTGGQPAGKARVYLGERGGGRERLFTPVRYFADAGGRAVIRVPAKAELAVFAGHEQGFALVTLDVPGEKKRMAFDVQVAGATWVSGQVVDTDGKPVARARVYPRCTGHDGKGGWQDHFLDGVCMTTLELNYRRALSDAEGRFRLPFADVGCTLSITAWKYEDDGTRWEAAAKLPETVLTGEGISDLRIVLKKK